MTQTTTEKLRLYVLVVSLSFLGVILLLSVTGVSRTEPILPTSVSYLGGYGYAAPIPERLWLLTNRADDGTAPRRSRTILEENGVALGPAHSVHEDIQRIGSGRYSHWEGDLLFSSSDNSDPRINGRTYEVVLTLEPRPSLLAASFLIAMMALWLERRRIREALMPAVIPVLRVPGFQWSIENVLPGLSVSVAAVVVLLLIVEAYLRLTVPFVVVVWPIRFDPALGFTFQPSNELQYTNHLNFWVSETTNSLGFLDREPLHADQGERGCRVTFLGDSFVEAAQVSIDQKVQVVFERMSRRALPSLNIRANAFGFSGTGQLNQLTFYDVLVRPTRPKVVVLVIVANDMANNSFLLESIRNGWHPLHPPRQFARYDDRRQEIALLPIDPEWRSFLLHDIPADDRGAAAVLHRTFADGSYLYNWLYAHLSLQTPVFAARLRGAATPEEQYQHRIAQLKADPEFAASFTGWNYPHDWDMDLMFNARNLPPIFQDAITFTGFALDQFVIRARREGFHLLGVVTHSLFSSVDKVPRAKLSENPLEVRGAFNRVAKLLTERGIPFIDEQEYLISMGLDPRMASFKHDGHWSVQGHAWAAEAVTEYFIQHPELCQ